MMDSASLVYGYQGGTSAAVVNSPMEDNRPGGMTVGGIFANHSALGHQNPMFWVLILALLVLGYIGFMFDIKVGK